MGRPLTARQWCEVAAVLLVGSAATLVPKVLVRTPCGDACGGGAFDAPLYSAALIFVGGVCTRLFEVAVAVTAAAGRGDQAGGASSKPWRVWARLAAPALVFLVATTAQLYALESISGAVLAGLRGGMVLFTAVAAAAAGLPEAPKSTWAWCMATGSGAAAALIAIAAGLNSGSAASGGAAAVGVTVSLCAYGAVAVQFVLEQRLVKGVGALPPGVTPFTPGQVLAAEGGASLVASVLVWIALAAAFAQQPATTAAMWPLDVPSHVACCLRARPATLAGLSLAYLASSAAFNLLLLRLSSVSATFRAFLFTMRGAVTWAVELGLWYGAGGGSGAGAYGEPWGRWDWLQAVGYVALGVCGSLQGADAGALSASCRRAFVRQRGGHDGEGKRAPLLLNG
jgi:hypothetical protein